MCFVSFYVTLRDNMGAFFRDTTTQSHETIKHVLIYVLLTYIYIYKYFYMHEIFVNSTRSVVVAPAFFHISYLYTAAAHSYDVHLYVYLHKYIYIYKCIGYVWIATHLQQCISRWLCYILYSYFDSLVCLYMRRLQVISLMTSRTLFHTHSLWQNAVGSS